MNGIPTILPTLWFSLGNKDRLQELGKSSPKFWKKKAHIRRWGQLLEGLHNTHTQFPEMQERKQKEKLFEIYKNPPVPPQRNHDSHDESLERKKCSWLAWLKFHIFGWGATQQNFNERTWSILAIQIQERGARMANEVSLIFHRQIASWKKIELVIVRISIDWVDYRNVQRGKSDLWHRER